MMWFIKNREWLVLTLIVGVCISLGWYLGKITPKEIEEYRNLVTLSNPQHQQQVFHTATQNHHDICKEVWFVNKEGHRLQTRLYSDQSEIVWEQHNNHKELVENMNGVVCYMQEAITPDGQVLRYIKADTATYRYNNNELIAHDLQMTHYSLPEPKFTENLDSANTISNGTAQSASFSMTNDGPQYRADQVTISSRMGRLEADHVVFLRENWIQLEGNVHIILPDGAELSCAHAEIDCQALQGTFDGDKNHPLIVLLLQNPMGEIYANTMVVDYTNKEDKLFPSKITLDGHVRLYNYDVNPTTNTKNVVQYALADHAEYLFNEQKAYLRAQQGERVLFFDKRNEIEVSAPALTIRRDQITQKELFEGLGDVRFHFKEAERERLFKNEKV